MSLASKLPVPLLFSGFYNIFKNRNRSRQKIFAPAAVKNRAPGNSGSATLCARTYKYHKNNHLVLGQDRGRHPGVG